MCFWPVNEMIELDSGTSAPQFEDESSWVRGSGLVLCSSGSCVTFWLMSVRRSLAHTNTLMAGGVKWQRHWAHWTLCEQQCKSHRLTCYLILFSVNRQRIFPADFLNFEWKIRGINGGGIKMICNLVLDIVFSLDFWKYLKNCIELMSSLPWINWDSELL